MNQVSWITHHVFPYDACMLKSIYIPFHIHHTWKSHCNPWFWRVILFGVYSELISVPESFWTFPTNKWPVCRFTTNFGMQLILAFLAKHFLAIAAYYCRIIFLQFLIMFLQFVFWYFCSLVTTIITSSYVTIIQVPPLVHALEVLPQGKLITTYLWARFNWTIIIFPLPRAAPVVIFVNDSNMPF